MTSDINFGDHPQEHAGVRVRARGGRAGSWHGRALAGEKAAGSADGLRTRP